MILNYDILLNAIKQLGYSMAIPSYQCNQITKENQ